MALSSHEFDVSAAYAAILIYSICAVLLICIIVHLYITARQEYKKKDGQEKSTIFCLVLTMIAIISFLLSLLLIIATLLQVILIDGHQLHPESNPFHEFYYRSFEEMEYFIAIFDAFGHLCMLTVFVKRFEICFQNSVFGYSSRFIRILYGCLICLALMSLIIIAEIIRDDHDVYLIIISEIIWELLIEIMCLWLLWLFISKLYKLLQMTVNLSMNNDKKNLTAISRFNELKTNINQSILETKLSTNRSHSKSKSEKSKTSKSDKNHHAVNESNNRSDRKQSVTTTKKAAEEGTMNSGYDMERIQQRRHKKSPENEHEASYTIHSNRENTHCCPNNQQQILATPQTSPQIQCNYSLDGENVNEDGTKRTYDPQIIDVVNVMNKMTLLVIISVFGSILSVIGNIFVEIHELHTIQDHTADMEQMWGFSLPVIDMIITSFMLYLQFNFTQSVYIRVCTKIDVLFLKCCLNINQYWIIKQENHERQKVIREKEKEPEKDMTVKTRSSGNTRTLSMKTITESSKAISSTKAISNDEIIDDHGIEIVTLPRLTPANSLCLDKDAVSVQMEMTPEK